MAYQPNTRAAWPTSAPPRLEKREKTMNIERAYETAKVTGAGFDGEIYVKVWVNAPRRLKRAMEEALRPIQTIQALAESNPTRAAELAEALTDAQIAQAEVESTKYMNAVVKSITDADGTLVEYEGVAVYPIVPDALPEKLMEAISAGVQAAINAKADDPNSTTR